MQSSSFTFTCKVNINLSRGPIHSPLCPPVDLVARHPLEYKARSYWTRLCFNTFRDTPHIAAIFPESILDHVGLPLFFLNPVLKAGWEAAVQWAYISVGWAILHAALPSNAGYDTSVSTVMRTGAVGGAFVQIIVLGWRLLPAILHILFCKSLAQPSHDEQSPARELTKRNAVALAVSFPLRLIVEMMGAALAAVLGTAVLRTTQSPTLDMRHAVLSSLLGSAVLFIPQVVWYLV
ncbi:hypothetical protein OH77DRAFT_856234 [Trametes cingulata]|nr:hypothetical protein OH77DRAFT_856234 [Trametes cingulata]